MRLVELSGKKEKVSIDFTEAPKKVYIANSVEKREKEIKKKGKVLNFDVSPFQILTLEIQF